MITVKPAGMLRPRRDWRDRLSALGLAPDDHGRIERALELAGPQRGMRAAVVSPIEPLLRRHRPAALERYHALISGSRSTGPFAFAPYRSLVPTLLAAVAAAFPGEPVQPRLDTLIARFGEPVRRLPMFSPLYRACEGDLVAFLEATAHGSSLIYNHGSMRCQRVGPAHALLRYEAHVSDCLRIFLVGYYRGILAAFGHAEHEVCFDRVSDSVCELHLIW